MTAGWLVVVWGFVGIIALLALAARYNVWRWPKPLGWPRILMYHRIQPAAANRLRGEGITATTTQFEAHLNWLAAHGARFVTVSELMAAENPAHMVAITFDDGYADNFSHAWPILKKFSAPATIYLAPDMPDIERLSPEMIAEMSAAGIEFGAHTMTHIHLPSNNDTRALAEIQASKAAVESLTGRPCMSFAYPYGKYSDKHVAMVAAAGFSTAVTTKKKILPRRKFDPLCLPRLSMVGQMNGFEFWLTITRGRYRV
ncbi:polysaccharide deacetylase family protein [Halothiobacillus neapolitanus]|uniref:Polysaccharide deacetylase n=1 Tax=Halothiobacillus neapolitanus (strain ATCC 23641 / DSM 15147 / CIP 104769 / NCIMB 8539 / c2) TaxID=555778 RepID=D0KW41_HALNC|nr:polysaccharide deacetylase family protein [Halothiobacillus neapolitanus]ACX96944.1 polysaccharide deacetylase [Halothiobacillus neapolitanus c2]TDN64941.1 polysaccharide deacetylase [Halothiobacillus neapolitanus]